MLEEPGLQETAARLLAAAGLPGEVVALTRLTGGRNNRVFLLERAGAAPLVLKRYHHDPRDTRDRLGAEWAFLRYAWDDCGLHCVPPPLAAEATTHSALYGFVPGGRIAAAGASHVSAAADFVARLNLPAARDAAARLAPGSEACFSMAAHAQTVARRVARLAGGLDPEAPHARAAAALVQQRLVPLWAQIERGLPRDESATPWCVSPSDFGFHNALADAAGGLVWLDFEYAGRDDPAKLVCDFFCQPEVPAPGALYAGFRDAVLGALALDAATHRARCDALLPAYRVKWACIMLNDFLATDAARRSFAEGGERAARCAAQLAKADAALGKIFEA
jgi:hypothetical protein